MTHSSSPSSSNMDHESTMTPKKVEGERPILPPISSMDGFFASRSWPPPATSLPTSSGSVVSPGSSSSYMSMQETILSPPITRNTATNSESWSPTPNRSSNDFHPHNQPRLDYFTNTAASATINAAQSANNSSSASSSSTLSPMDTDNIRSQQTYVTDHNRDHHYRQNSLPHVSTFRKNSISSIISHQQQQQSATAATPITDQQSIFRYQPNSTTPFSSSSASSSLINNLNTLAAATSSSSAGAIHNNSNNSSSSINSNNTNNNASIELVLAPTSLSTPSMRSTEKDIEEVIRHCNSLSDNMNQKKSSIVENDNYISDPTSMQLWLDDMISRANEVLNALLRLRKHQLAAEYARIHRIPDHQHNRHGAEGISQTQDNENWDNASNMTMTSTSGVMSLNSVRIRKRGKRPVFQGRCHSCNISETPEWRRGPDGARTLCNACGLHYAKLAKKKVKQPEDVKKGTTEEDRDDTSMK